MVYILNPRNAVGITSGVRIPVKHSSYVIKDFLFALSIENCSDGVSLSLFSNGRQRMEKQGFFIIDKILIMLNFLRRENIMRAKEMPTQNMGKKKCT